MKVVLDIETVRAPREEWARVAGRRLVSGEAVFSETEGDLFAVGQAEEQHRLDEEHYEKSSFDGTFSKIICIGLLEFSDNLDPRGATSWYGGNEHELLLAFWSHLGQLRPSLFITHNGLGFDLPVYQESA